MTEVPPAPPADVPSDSEPTPLGRSRPAISPQRRLRALMIGTVIAVALAVFLFVGLGHKATGSNGTQSTAVVGVGSAAPDFTLQSLTGGAEVHLNGLGVDRHRPVVLNFFASWCVPCQEETPLLAKTAAALEAKGSIIQFVGVDVADLPLTKAQSFVQQSGITYPVGIDPDLHVTATLYGLNGQPNTFFIDANGQVIGHVIGAVSEPTFSQYLHRLGGASA